MSWKSDIWTFCTGFIATVYCQKRKLRYQLGTQRGGGLQHFIRRHGLKNVDSGIFCFGAAVGTQPEVDWRWWWLGKLLLLRCVVTRNRAIVVRMRPTRHQPSVHTHTVTHSDILLVLVSRCSDESM